MDFATHLNFDAHDQVVGVLYLSLLKRALEADGLTLKSKALSDQDLSNPKLRISLTTFLTVLSDSLEGAPPGIGLRYGQHLNLVAADSLGQLIMSCDTLGEAMRQLHHYRLLLTLPFGFEHLSHSEYSDEQACVSFRGLFNEQLSDEVNWFVSEVLFQSILNQATWLSGRELGFSALHFPYEKPPHFAQYEHMLHCPCIFSSPKHAMVFDANYLNLPVVTRNSELKKHKQVICDEALKRWTKNFSTRHRLRAVFKQRYPHLPCIDEAAATLELSRSCLHRRLHDEGTSYQAQVNAFKKQRSEYLLKHTSYTMSEIAEELGFSDSSTFRRAFKSWTGMQPSAVREETA